MLVTIWVGYPSCVLVFFACILCIVCQVLVLGQGGLLLLESCVLLVQSRGGRVLFVLVPVRVVLSGLSSGLVGAGVVGSLWGCALSLPTFGVLQC